MSLSSATAATGLPSITSAAEFRVLGTAGVPAAYLLAARRTREAARIVVAAFALAAYAVAALFPLFTAGLHARPTAASFARTAECSACSTAVAIDRHAVGVAARFDARVTAVVRGASLAANITRTARCDSAVAARRARRNTGSVATPIRPYITTDDRVGGFFTAKEEGIVDRARIDAKSNTRVASFAISAIRVALAPWLA